MNISYFNIWNDTVRTYLWKSLPPPSSLVSGLKARCRRISGTRWLDELLLLALVFRSLRRPHYSTWEPISSQRARKLYLIGRFHTVESDGSTSYTNRKLFFPRV